MGIGLIPYHDLILLIHATSRAIHCSIGALRYAVAARPATQSASLTFTDSGPHSPNPRKYLTILTNIRTARPPGAAAQAVHLLMGWGIY